MGGKPRQSAAQPVDAAEPHPRPTGRPRKHRYEQVFAALERPPRGDPLAIATWAQGIVALALFETVQGRGQREMNASIRALAGVIARLIPAERIAAAEKQIRAARTPIRPVARTGPEVEPFDDNLPSFRR